MFCMPPPEELAVFLVKVQLVNMTTPLSPLTMPPPRPETPPTTLSEMVQLVIVRELFAVPLLIPPPLGFVLPGMRFAETVQSVIVNVLRLLLRGPQRRLDKRHCRRRCYRDAVGVRRAVSGSPVNAVIAIGILDGGDVIIFRDAA